MQPAPNPTKFGLGPNPKSSGTGTKAPAQRKPVALLSFFDGISSAHQSLLDIGVRPVLSWAWELDPACQQVVKSRHPEVVQKGDALTTDPAGVIEALRTQCQKDTFVLVACAPPCPDFSQIKGSLSLGTAGPEGRKFVDWIHKWWKPFSSSCKFELGFLVENVTMSQQVQTSLDDLLQTRSFMSDAASFGLVSRPRLWWASHIKPPEEPAPNPTKFGLGPNKSYSLRLSRSQPAWPAGESGIGTGNSFPAVRGSPDRSLRRAVWGGLANQS